MPDDEMVGGIDASHESDGPDESGAPHESGAPPWAHSTVVADATVMAEAPPEPEAPAPPTPSWPAPPESTKRERAPRQFRTALAAGVIGAVLGGGIAGGIVAAVDNDSAPSATLSTAGTAATAQPSTALAKPGDIRSILETARPAVVRIDATSANQFGGTQQGTGTGFIIDPSGIIVTNNHVVAGATQLTVTLNDGDQVRGKVLGTAPAFDLAVVKIDRTKLPAIALGDSDQLQVGDAVVAIGNALGLEGGSGATVTTGIVSGLGRDVNISAEENLHNMIQTDAAINPGNSGGPLVDTRGRVIGINTAIASPDSSNNVGFAIPISGALPIIDDLRAGKTAQAAFLGVTTMPLTPSAAQQKKLPVTSGAIIRSVQAGSPAAKASLRKDDVIVDVGGVAVHTPVDVFAAVRRHRPGDTVKITVVRGDQRVTADVTLASTSQ